MSKIIDSLVQASIDSKDFSGVLLVKLDFDRSEGPYRYTNAYQTVYWDEDGGGEEEYLGLGNLGSISSLVETSELSSQTIQLSISGIPQDSINSTFDKTLYQNRPVFIWYGLLDKDTLAVESGTNGPILIYAGLMDYCTFEFGKNASISLIASSRLADWERPRGGRFNAAYQRTYVDPTDSGFKYVVPLQNKDIRWAGTSVGDSGSADWPTSAFSGNQGPVFVPGVGMVGGGTSDIGGGCFTPETLITMIDGTKKPISEIKVGDMIKSTLEGQAVTAVTTYDYDGPLYSINNSDYFVTDSHPFKTLQGWKAFNPILAMEEVEELFVEELIIGDTLLTDLAQTKIIKSIDSKPEKLKVYNLTISGTKEYFANGYLVHNAKQRSSGTLRP